jgi:hypothetical protein
MRLGLQKLVFFKKIIIIKKSIEKPFLQNEPQLHELNMSGHTNCKTRT